MSRRPPRSTRTDTLFPYTTLFRSPVRGDVYHSDENLLTAIPGYRGKSGWQARAIAAVAADMRWPFIGEFAGGTQTLTPRIRSEEHTSELQSLMRISYAVFCLKKKNNQRPVTLETTESKHTS